MKIRNSYHLYASVTILFWSFAYVLTRLALQYFSALPLGFLRYFTASLALCFLALRGRLKLPRSADLPLFFASGAAGFFVYMIAFNLGQARVTASTASVVIATVPVVTALLARVFYREQLRPFQWVAIAVEFAGVGVLTLTRGALSINSGVLWLLTAAVSMSVYNLLQRRLLETYTPLQASTFSIFAGTVLLAVFSPAAAREIAGAPPVQVAYLAILGIFCSAAANIAWTKALSLAKQTSQVSNYMFVTPFLASILGFVIAGEAPDGGTLLGGAIILLGVFVFRLGGRVRPRFHG